MALEYSVSLQKLVKNNALEVLYTPKELDEIFIKSKDVNRPGLILAGYHDFFDPSRIQFFGLTEFGFIDSLTREKREKCLEHFFSFRPSCVICSRSIEPAEDFMALAKKNEVPVLRSADSTSGCMSTLISFLGVELAERITRHGVFVEVYGEGVLIVGNSGVGKSETAIELINRGHRLIADDAVEIKRVSAKTLVGSAPEIIRHYVELRGIGIVDVKRLFGMGAVKDTEKINLVINLEQWFQGKMYDRLGLDDEKMDILGIEIPSITIPVKPGRNLAIILEIAAMNNRQKRMGYNTAEEFNKRLMEQMGGGLPV